MKKWLLYCTNPDCFFFFEKAGEPDYICARCGGKVEVNEKIIEEDNKE